MRLRVIVAFVVPITASLLVGVLIGSYVVGPFIERSASATTRSTPPGPAGTAGAGSAAPSPTGATGRSPAGAATSGGASGAPTPVSSTAPGTPAAPSAPPVPLAAAKEGVVPILYYHRVEALPPGFVTWSKARQDTFLVDDLMPYALVAQLDWLAAHGYTTILPRDLAAHWDHGTPLPARPIILTFDDGFKNWVTFVMPQLRKHHMVAEFYVTLANIGAINFDDVRALARAGMGIGAHDVHHVQIAGAGIVTSAATMRYEVTQAKRQLEQQSGVTVDSMAYVGGGFNEALMAIVQGAGYTTARSIERGVLQSPSIRFHLHVSRVSWKDDVIDIYRGTMVPGLPMFGKRVSGANLG